MWETTRHAVTAAHAFLTTLGARLDLLDGARALVVPAELTDEQRAWLDSLPVLRTRPRA